MYIYIQRNEYDSSFHSKWTKLFLPVNSKGLGKHPPIIASGIRWI